MPDNDNDLVNSATLADEIDHIILGLSDFSYLAARSRIRALTAIAQRLATAELIQLAATLKVFDTGLRK